MVRRHQLPVGIVIIDGVHSGSQSRLRIEQIIQSWNCHFVRRVHVTVRVLFQLLRLVHCFRYHQTAGGVDPGRNGALQSHAVELGSPRGVDQSLRSGDVHRSRVRLAQRQPNDIHDQIGKHTALTQRHCHFHWSNPLFRFLWGQRAPPTHDVIGLFKQFDRDDSTLQHLALIALSDPILPRSGPPKTNKNKDQSQVI